MTKFGMRGLCVVSYVLLVCLTSASARKHHTKIQHTTITTAASQMAKSSTKIADDTTTSGSSKQVVSTIPSSIVVSPAQLASADQNPDMEATFTEPVTNLQLTTNGSISPLSTASSNSLNGDISNQSTKPISTMPNINPSTSEQVPPSDHASTSQQETPLISTKPVMLPSTPIQRPTQAQSSGTAPESASPTMSEILNALQQYNGNSSANETNIPSEENVQLQNQPITAVNITTLGDLLTTMSELKLAYLDDLKQVIKTSNDSLLFRLLNITDVLNITTIQDLIGLASRQGIYLNNSTAIEDVIEGLEQMTSGTTTNVVTDNTVANELVNVTEPDTEPTTTDEYSRMETVTNEMFTVTSEPTTVENTATVIQLTTTSSSSQTETTTATTLPATELITTTGKMTIGHPVHDNSTIVYTNQNRTSAHTHMINYRDPEFGGLVAAVIFGCLFLVIIIVFIVKRCYDGYQRRHYTKLDYLVNGMYN